MTYITTDIPQPGIVELLFYKGATGKALSKLAHTLLQGPSQLSSGERELIASYVSNLNNCEYCHESHSASASVHLNDHGVAVSALKLNTGDAPVSDKMKALFQIAAKVQIGGKEVKSEDIEEARKLGASDEDIHDTVLIAAAFCMYNRYVDGLGTNLPDSRDDYADMGLRMAKVGYKYPPLFLRKWVIRRMRKANKKKSV